MVNSKGGKAIGRGGYGCVFKPALKCQGFKKNQDEYISKLMCKKDAIEEMQKIKNISNILYSIPFNKEYFIPNKEQQFFLCDLDQIDDSNLENSNICVNLTSCEETSPPSTEYPFEPFQKDFDEEDAIHWIKYNREDLLLIQQPDGGIEFKKFIENMENSEKQIKNITNELINLMQNGVKQMNDKGLLHMDMKAENLLINKNNIIRIIDWGLSINTNDKEFNLIKRNIISHVIQFNIPISNILFNYTKIVKNNDTIMTDKIIDNLVGNILRKVHNKGHWKYTIQLMRSLDIEDPIKNMLIYLKTILVKYANFKNNILETENFFNDVFKHNVDIYSIFICYVEMIESERVPKKYLEKLKSLCRKYMFSTEYAVKKYDLNIIVNELNEIFELDKISLEDKEFKKAHELHKKNQIKRILPIHSKKINSKDSQYSIDLLKSVSANDKESFEKDKDKSLREFIFNKNTSLKAGKKRTMKKRIMKKK